MPKTNPEILRWARETSGLNLEEASKILRLNPARGLSPEERLRSFELGENEPTKPMLRNMAKRYNRPLILFYLKRIPRTANTGEDFRTLPDSYSSRTEGLVKALIRDIYSRQGILRSALEDDEDTKKLNFVGSMQITDGIEKVIDDIKNTINFDLKLYRKKANSREAFKYLRSLVAKIGIYVLLIGELRSHQNSFDVTDFRGFVLSDEIAPFIVINDKDSKSACSFTLLHELAHIWLGNSGISGSPNNNIVERFCNQVSSELLLPRTDLDRFVIDKYINYEELLDSISTFANSYNISSSMVAYKLFLIDKIDRSTWERLSLDYKNFWSENRSRTRQSQKGKRSGPNYYVIKRYRLGESLITDVHSLWRSGQLSTSKASKVLGIQPKNIHKLTEPMSRIKA